MFGFGTSESCVSSNALAPHRFQIVLLELAPCAEYFAVGGSVLAGLVFQGGEFYHAQKVRSLFEPVVFWGGFPVDDRVF